MVIGGLRLDALKSGRAGEMQGVTRLTRVRLFIDFWQHGNDDISIDQ